MKYVDVDGVLADFEKWVKTKDTLAYKGDYKNKEGHSKVARVIIEHYKECFLESEIIGEGLKFLCSEYKILTALPKKETLLKNMFKHEEHLIDEILETLRKNKIIFLKSLGIKESDIIISDGALDKLNFCKSEDDILIDDNKKTIRLWNEKGGRGIIFNIKKIRKKGVK